MNATTATPTAHNKIMELILQTEKNIQVANATNPLADVELHHYRLNALGWALDHSIFELEQYIQIQTDRLEKSIRQRTAREISEISEVLDAMREAYTIKTVFN